MSLSRPVRPWIPPSLGSSVNTQIEVDERWVKPSAAGTGQITDGAAVAYIGDQARGGSANPVVQATVANQPTWRSYSHVRARPIITFDGVDDFLLGTTNRTFRWALVAGMVLPPNVTRNSEYGTLFANWQGGINRGIVNLNAPTAPALIFTGLANGLSEFAGLFGWASYSLDGVTGTVANPYAGFPRVTHLWLVQWNAATAPNNFSGAPLVIGRDRDQANTYWYGGFRGMAGFTSAASAGNVTNAYNYMARRWWQCSTGVCVLGDSIGAGYGLLDSESWASLFQTRTKFNFDMLNLSKPGQTVPGSITDNLTSGRAQAFMARYGRKVFVIALGTNDTGTTALLVNSGSVATCITNLTTMISTIRAAFPDAIIGIANFSPRANPPDANLNPGWVGPGGRREVFNTTLAANYLAMGANYLIDIAGNAIIGPDAAASDAAKYPDGVHPSAFTANIMETIYWSQCLVYSILL